MLGYPSNIILVWKERKSLNWKIWLPLTALVVAGSIPGIFLLKHTDAGLLKVIFGIAVIVIGVEMLFREMKSNRESSNRKSGGSKLVLVLIGIISGLLCGLYGVGALLAAYVSRVAENSHEFKANLCGICGGKYDPHYFICGDWNPDTFRAQAGRDPDSIYAGSSISWHEEQFGSE